MNTAWFGLTEDVNKVLDELNADRGSTGAYIVEGIRVVGIGQDEVIMDKDATYQIGGVKHTLVPELSRRASGGMIVGMIA